MNNITEVFEVRIRRNTFEEWGNLFYTDSRLKADGLVLLLALQTGTTIQYDIRQVA